MDRGAPNNPLKQPFLVMCVLIAVFTAVVGGVLAANGLRLGWLLVSGGVALVALSYVPIRVIRQGRNPWWMRSPLDRRWRTSRAWRVTGIVLFVAAAAIALLGFVLIVLNLLA